MPSGAFLNQNQIMKKHKTFVKYAGLCIIICLGVCLVSFKKMKRIVSGETDDAIYQFTVAKRGMMIDDGTCYAWIPGDVGTVRGVIVHLHGCTREGDAWQMMYDLQWRELARKWHCALIAPKFITGGVCGNWCNPKNGSDGAFLEMLDKLADKSNHPEVKNVPWVLWGHSGGAGWVTTMANKYPERVATMIVQACGSDISDNPATLKIPILHHNGVMDLCYQNASLFAKGRAKGALWAHAVNPVVESAMDGHQVHDMRFLAIPWIDACLALRLPEKAGDSKLRDINISNPWLADTAKRTIAQASAFKGDKNAACWFPNQALAEKWVQYMATGTVVDKTPPPAPYDISASYSKNTLLLRWRAMPDLESGIKTFIVYRDGAEYKTMQYHTKTKYNSQTGFQRWNDGDQPSPVSLPEMAYTDENIDNKTTYTYQVSTVNWSDVPSAKSKIITLANGEVK
jgi:pimeloyl-ACP methyl ester carboxylesterase